MSVPDIHAVLLPLEILGTEFRRRRLEDLGWRLHSRNDAQFIWVDVRRRLTVMEGRELHAGEAWHHVSMSHADRLPTWMK